MLKLLYCVVFVVAAALVACSSPTPTPDPTATPVPTLPPPPTATATPAPEPTMAAARPVSASGVIAPINMDDPQALLAALSESEQSCLDQAGGDPLQLREIVGGAPQPPSPGDAAEWIDCLSGDTLMLLFLSGLITEIGPLSEDTSACVRAGFGGFDMRPIMLAGTAEADPETAMMGSMAAFFLTVSCLNEAEWQIGAPSLGFNLDDREGLQCVMATLGGPAEVAAALMPADSGPPVAFLEAASECGVAGTTDSGSSGTPDPSGMAAPGDTAAVQALVSELTGAEQSCLSEKNSDPQQIITLAGFPGGAPINSPEEADALIGCLSDDSLMRVFQTGLLAGTTPLSAESSACANAGFANFDLRSVMLAGGVNDDPATALAGSMAAFTLTFACLNDAEWQAAAPRLGLNPGDREGLQCVMATLGGPEELAAALQPADGGQPTAFFDAAEECGLDTGIAPGG